MTEETREIRSLDELAIALKEGWQVRLTRHTEDKINVPALDWKTKDDKPNFAWAWVGDREGRVSPENAAFRDLLKERKELRQGEYSYKLSADAHFFNRIKHDLEK
ncbi:MAG: hypothetical protein M1587_00085 [Thaumarchaeota archaeon]|nr:hypothetical protein [Nitrososphaerota archaeon]MCL5068570.1 hypothetical protein [Nitrososphaerota archaeon]